MLDKDYPGQVCSIARALEIVGERWTLLVVRDVFLGVRRFDELVADLGVTRTVLTHRLRTLVDAGVLHRHRYQDRPERFEYQLTEKGHGLLPVLATLMWWGDAHYAGPEGPPRRLVHTGCGGSITPTFACAQCGTTIAPTEVEVQSAPWVLAAGAHLPAERGDPGPDPADS